MVYYFKLFTIFFYEIINIHLLSFIFKILDLVLFGNDIHFVFPRQVSCIIQVSKTLTRQMYLFKVKNKDSRIMQIGSILVALSLSNVTHLILIFFPLF